MFAQLFVIGLSTCVIFGGNSLWESLWPQRFWKQQVAELEKCAKKDHWYLKSVEWNLMRGRMELSIAVSAAEDKGECFGVDCQPFIGRAKEESVLRLRKLIGEEAKAKTAYQETLKRLEEAKAKAALYQPRN